MILHFFLAKSDTVLCDQWGTHEIFEIEWFNLTKFAETERYLLKTCSVKPQSFSYFFIWLASLIFCSYVHNIFWFPLLGVYLFLCLVLFPSGFSGVWYNYWSLFFLVLFLFACFRSKFCFCLGPWVWLLLGIVLSFICC